MIFFSNIRKILSQIFLNITYVTQLLQHYWDAGLPGSLVPVAFPSTLALGAPRH